MTDGSSNKGGVQSFSEWRPVVFWFLFASLVVFHLVANVWWQALDIRPVRTDEEVHMQTARDYYVAFTERPKQDNPLKLLIDVASVRPGNPVHPPLLHMLGALMILVRGYSLDTISLTVTWLFLLAMPGCYLIARRFLGPWQALFATFVFSFTPIIYGSSRWFMTDFLSMTIVVWAVYALLRTDYFHNTLWVFIFAILNGLGILARTTTFLFYLAPCAALVLWGLWLALRSCGDSGSHCARGTAPRAE
ncbi:MAG: glycosyltransferase family 39 protein [Candidatus Hydrogenedentes bacterium]|nr:glycosyltransferase family 39 protein [Candidatus Hydrogenedentota bacterium]